MTKLFVHLGPCRTGSTTLQKFLFQQHKDINYLGKPYTFNGHVNFSYVMGLNEEKFIQLSKNLENKINKIYLDSKKTNLLSDENFLNFFSHASFNYVRTIGRINDLFKKRGVELNFFYLIRKQEKILPSYFLQNFSILKSIFKVNDFYKIIIENLREKNNNGWINHLLNQFKYYDIHENLLTIAGKNVKFFFYEKFKHKETEFLDELSEYLEISKDETRKIMVGKKTHVSSIRIKNPNKFITNPKDFGFRIKIYHSLVHNIIYKEEILKNFRRKTATFFGLIKELSPFYKSKRKRNIKENNEEAVELYKQLNMQNLQINKFYHENNVLFEEKYLKDLTKLNYKFEKVKKTIVA